MARAEDGLRLTLTILLNGSPTEAAEGEPLIDLVLRSAVELPHVCYHPQLGPVQTCDTCLVEVGGELVRACSICAKTDYTNPFYRYDPDQCILCGRCAEACQNLQVNKTLSVGWEDPHPRVLWDGGSTIAESSCVSCGHCVTVWPCNALMETSMLHHAGFMTGRSKTSLDSMIDIKPGPRAAIRSQGKPQLAK